MQYQTGKECGTTRATIDRLRQQWLGKLDTTVNADDDLPDCRLRRQALRMGCATAARARLAVDGVPGSCDAPAVNERSLSSG
ncbi:MAG TPA: hypothetical protein VJ652_10095 [Noviherbaspirillum sp.]|nr:hypothetical protein [Noviherbaspirillum sp.]